VLERRNAPAKGEAWNVVQEERWQESTGELHSSCADLLTPNKSCKDIHANKVVNPVASCV